MLNLVAVQVDISDSINTFTGCSRMKKYLDSVHCLFPISSVTKVHYLNVDIVSILRTLASGR